MGIEDVDVCRAVLGIDPASAKITSRKKTC
jgi:hypothetical protein